MLLASMVQGRQVHIWYRMLLLNFGLDCDRNLTMFGMCFCLSCAGKQELFGHIQMRPGDDLRLCYQEHNEEYSKKLAVYNLVAGYYLFFLLQGVLLF